MTSKRTVRGNGDRRLVSGGGLGSLSALFASQAQAQAQDGAPNDFVRIDALEGVQSYETMPDGTLRVLLADGRTISLAADQFVVTEAGLFLDLPALTEAMTAVAAAGVGASPLLLPVIAGAGGLGLAAAGGGGGGDDSASPPSPPAPSPPAPPPPPPANNAPVLTSGATATVAENTSTSVYTAVATDTDGNNITYSLAGADAALFNINSSTGVVNFKVAPDFEVPADTGANNTYEISVSASDSLATTSRAVVISVTNQNDNAPSIRNAESTGNITEDSVTAISGSVAFADADLGNDHSVNVVADGAGYFGDLSAALANTATSDGLGSVDWTFDVDNNDLQHLAEGEALSQSYTLTISDGAASVTQKITVTITGTNDAPAIDAAISSGVLTEADTSADGTIEFSDLDLADAHSVSVTPAASGYVGLFSASATGAVTGSGLGEVSWSFSIDNSLLAYLADGETVVQIYSVEISDDHGGTVAQDITITFTGGNDTPTLTSAVTAGVISEDGVLSASGMIAFADADLADTHTVDITAAAGGYLGLFQAIVADDATADGAGQIGWTFTVDNALLQTLAQGETRTQTYTVTVSDAASGQISQDITITITGANDTPTIHASLVATNQGMEISGQLTANDVDGDTVTFTAATNPQHGTLLLQSSGVYTYVPANDFSGTDSFTVTIEDENGATDTAAVTIDVAGGETQVRYIFETYDSVSLTVTGTQDSPEVTALADGGHLVVWMAAGSANSDNSGYGVYAQRYGAAGEKVGATFLVNTITTNNQLYPSAAGLNDGSFVVIWQSDDTSNYGIYAQRFAADGTKTGGEVLVNTTTANIQYEGTVTALTNGGYAVTWAGYNATTSSEDVYARAFDANGAPATGEFVVNTITTGTQRTIGQIAESITSLTGGRFALTFMDMGGADGSSYGIYARVFEADGTPVNAAQVLVNTTTLYDQYYSSIGALADGGFVVTWSDPNGVDGSGWSVLAQRFDASGARVGGEFQPNTYTYSTQINSKVEQLSDGGFVIVWQSYGVDGNGQYAIAGQRYAANGAKAGGEFVVNSTNGWSAEYPSITLREDGALVVVWRGQGGQAIEQTIIDDFVEDTTPAGVDDSDNVNLPISGSQDSPEVTALADGGHLVVWMSQGSSNPDTSNYGIYAQRYDAAGEKVGSPVLVNTYTNSGQYYPSAAGLDDGSYVVTWQSSGQDGSGWGIYAQRFAANGTKTGGEALVTTTVASSQLESSVTALTGGGYAVTWRGYNAGTSSEDVYVRVFNASGVATTGELLVNTTTSGHQATHAWITETIAGLTGGRFAVAFVDDNDTDGDGAGIFVRVFEANGVAVNATQVAVNTTTAGSQYYGSIGALSDGGFVVTWSDPNGIDGSDWGVLAQRFDAGGGKVGAEFLANTYTYSTQLYSKVEQLSDGGFVIVWQTYGHNNSGQYDIAGQRYAADGTKINGEFIVNSANGWSEELPSVALRDDGAILIVWRGQNGQSIEQKIIDDFAEDTTPIDSDPDANVNLPISGYQDLAEVTALADGGHLVVWSANSPSYLNPDTSDYGVYAQRYDSAGEKVGGPTLVNFTTDENQYSPSAAGLSDGSYVVVWQSLSQDGSGWGLFAKHFAADGTQTSGEMQINTITTNDQSEATVAALTDGGYAVTWTGYNAVNDTTDIYARVFQSSGVALGDEFLVNTTTSGYQYTYGQIAETVTGLAGGRFAVTFTDQSDADGSTYGVYVRVFEANGTPVNAAQVLVNTTTANYQYSGSIGALADGGFVVAWTDNNRDGSGSGIFAQRFDAGGVKVGGEFQANTYAYSSQEHAKIERLSDGGFVIVWHSYGIDGNGQYAIAGQRYAADGTKTSGEFVVSSGDGWSEETPSIALREDGALVVVWRSQNGTTIEQKIITSFDAESAAAKTIVGGPGADSLLGWAQADTLDGAGGNDRIAGLGGADTLTGATGNDMFVYFAPDEGGDTITDFTPGQDKIEVSASGFGGGLLVGGAVTLIASLNPAATGSGGAFLYKTDTGELFWDQDGNGAQTRVLIATLTGTPVLAAADFVVTAIVGDGGSTPPIVLDLDGDGLHFMVGNLFDYDGDGALERGAWQVGDAILALDRDADGAITSGAEISFVGDAEGATSDLEGLAGHDENGDGVISSADAIFDRLILWSDANHDGVSQVSELGTLAAAGVTSISLTSDGGSGADAYGNIIHGRADVAMADGSTRQAADISLRYYEMGNDASSDQHVHQIDAELIFEADDQQSAHGQDHGWQ